MISISNISLAVVFDGSVRMRVSRFNGRNGKLSFGTGKKEIVGEKIEDFPDDFPVELIFENLVSVDLVIECLQRIKVLMASNGAPPEHPSFIPSTKPK